MDLNRLASRISNDSFVIFLFHGVIKQNTTQVRNYTRKHLTEEVFASFLDACIEERGVPVSLDDVIQATLSGTPLPERAFSITFDDGFLNNLEVAAPVLLARDIPATFYVTSEFIQKNTMSWIDRVELAFEDRDVVQLHLPWGEREAHTAAEKCELLDEIRAKVKTSPDISADAFADDVQLQLLKKHILGSAHPLDQKMTWPQVRELNSLKGMSVGGHSHTHAMLAFLPDKELEDEINTSMDCLSENLPGQILHYSYPEGQREHYDARVIQKLKDHGIVCCPTAIDGVNPRVGNDLFHLKRVMVQ